MIIWDELKHGENIYKRDETTTKRWEQKELKILIKYMLHNKSLIEYKSNEDDDKILPYKTVIKKKLTNSCGDDIKYLTNKQRNNIFDKLIKQAESECIITNINVRIYKSEIEFIHSINDIKKEKVLFTLLVYKKWLNEVSKVEFDNQSIKLIAKIKGELIHLSKEGLKNTIEYSEMEEKYKDTENKEFLVFDYFYMMKNDIFKIARLNTINSTVRQDIVHWLLSNKYISSDVVKTSEKDRKGSNLQKRQMYKIDWIHQQYKSFNQFKNNEQFVEDSEDEIAFKINDFDNLITYYEEYVLNSKYFECGICRERILKESNSQKYCKSCAKEIKNEQNKNYYLGK